MKRAVMQQVGCDSLWI